MYTSLYPSIGEWKMQQAVDMVERRRPDGVTAGASAPIASTSAGP